MYLNGTLDLTVSYCYGNLLIEKQLILNSMLFSFIAVIVKNSIPYKYGLNNILSNFHFYFLLNKLTHLLLKT